MSSSKKTKLNREKAIETLGQLVLETLGAVPSDFADLDQFNKYIQSAKSGRELSIAVGTIPECAVRITFHFPNYNVNKKQWEPSVRFHFPETVDEFCDVMTVQDYVSQSMRISALVMSEIKQYSITDDFMENTGSAN